jgi:hypothetical protein
MRWDRDSSDWEFRGHTSPSDLWIEEICSIRQIWHHTAVVDALTMDGFVKTRFHISSSPLSPAK